MIIEPIFKLLPVQPSSSMDAKTKLSQSKIAMNFQVIFHSILELCLAKRKYIINPTEMTHSQFDFYSDLADPLR